MKKLDKKIKVVWFVLSFLGLVIFSIPVVIGIINVLNTNNYKLLLIPLGIIELLLILWFVLYPLLRYSLYSYSYNQSRITIKKGVIFRHTIIVPVFQIQDLHLYEGPLLLITKLGGVIISTAGSNYFLNGLKKDDCIVMINELEGYLKDRVEEKANEEI